MILVQVLLMMKVEVVVEILVELEVQKINFPIIESMDLLVWSNTKSLQMLLTMTWRMI